MLLRTPQHSAVPAFCAAYQSCRRACSSATTARSGGHADESGAQVLEEDIVTPWDVAAKGPKGISYDRVLTKFKADRVDTSVVSRLQSVLERTSERRGTALQPLHHFFSRDVVFSHRDFVGALRDVERSLEPGVHAVYLYTGRGPSADSMHVGHVIPFLLTKYLQEALGLPLVIQITDDEKYLFRGIPFDGEKANELITNNIKDIIAFGFNPRTTFIFRSTEYMGEMYKTVLPLQRSLTCNVVKNTLGLTDSDSVGKLSFPAIQAAPCFSSAFHRVLQVSAPKPMRCIVPCAIDQDPFFVLTRSVSSRLKWMQPSLLHTKFLPALKGMSQKMSSSAEQNGVITLHDTDAQVRKKMRRAFSGGKGTLDDMQAQGADLDVDVAYQFIKFFCPDEELFAEVTTRYAAGEMNSGEVKDIAADVVIKHVLADWRERRAVVTDEEVMQFCSIRNILF